MPCGTTTVSTFCARCRANGIVTSKHQPPWSPMSRFLFLYFLPHRFLRNPTELKSIKNISLLRQTMASQSANGQSAASAGGASNHSLMSLLPNGANIHHLAAAAAAAAASHHQANGGAPISPSALHHSHHQSQSSVQSSAPSNGIVNGHHIKMETDLDELKPTDLSTSDRKYYGTGASGVDCYP